jgi:HlyD family secretion protein
MRSRLAIGAAALVAVVTVAGIALKARRPAPMRITTAAVTVGRVQRDILTTGTLEPVTTVEVGSQISGTIAVVPVDYNSVVRKGEVLARLEPQTYEADLSRAEAALQDAQAQLASDRVALADAQTKLDRAQKELSAGLITEADLEAAQVTDRDANEQVLGAQAQIVTATANVNAAKVNLDHTVITSPIDGVVVSRQVDPGQTVAASIQTPVLFELAPDLHTMQLQATIDEAEIGGVRQGSPVQFTVGAYPNERFRGTIVQVRLQPIEEGTNKALPVGSTAAAVDPNAAATSTGAPTAGGTASANAQTTAAGAVVGYIAVANVANPDDRLRPGMTALVTLPGAFKDNVPRVPNVALAFQPPQDVLISLGPQAQLARKAAATSADRTAVVWEVDATGKPEPISIRTGLSDSQWTEVASGPLQANDKVITAMTRGD